MTTQSPTPSISKKHSPLPKPASPTGTIQAPDLQTLSPLQRQCLDTAVMLLVNHLVSASSAQ